MTSSLEYLFHASCASALFVSPLSAQVGNFTNWTMAIDPASPFFAASATATNATLTAGNGSIPNGTDIGYQSINGRTVSSSTEGFAFDPNASFSVAIDYALTFPGGSPVGGLGLGFGIGEDQNGKNSAGLGILTNNGGFSNPFVFFAGAARVNDVNQTPVGIFTPSTLTGCMFATYNAATGTVTLGASPNPGAVSPAATSAFAGIQNSWANRDLLVSFFIRSESLAGAAWQSGNAQAVFSNFRVLSGSPKRLAPVVTATSRLGNQFSIDFKGGTGGTYYVEGGSGLSAFPENLSYDLGTSIVENPANSGFFQATVDVTGKGPRYFMRISSRNPDVP